MMRKFLAASILFWLPLAFVQNLTFSEVYKNKTMGIDSLPLDEVDSLFEKAKTFAYYRKFPKTSKAADIWQACHDDRSINVLCEIILNPRENGTATPTPQAVRTRLNAALISLDNVKGRAKSCIEAGKVFEAIIQDPALYTLRSRALYWSWVCAKATKQDNEARVIKEKLWDEFPLGHHTLQVLTQDQDDRLDKLLGAEQDWQVALRSEKAPEMNAWIAAIEALQKLGEDGAAAVAGLYINAQIRDLEAPVRLYLAALMAQVAESVPSVLPVSRVLVPLFIDHHEYMTPSTLRLLFPLNYKFENEAAGILDLVNEYRGELNASLMLGLIHQESAFNPRAASSAGAYGLTQMLLPTAADQYRKLINDPKATVERDMLFKPRLSVQLGLMDFRWRLGQLKNDVILTLASYNAGVAGVKKWSTEVKKIQNRDILTDVLFLNRGVEFHVSQYVAMILARAAWYEKLAQSR